MEIYLVGGAVRDALLGIPVKERDWVVVGSNPEEMIDLGKEVDLMILECSTPDEMKLPGHLTPSACGKLAQKAGCRKLCLTHFYPTCDLKDIRTKCSSEYDGELFLAEDLMEFNI